MKISEMFASIQGEGRYQGTPVVFVRTSGCTRSCSFCDSKYHINGKEYDIEKLIKELEKFKISTIVWTGGEPTQYIKEIKEITQATSFYHHLETNGDLVEVRRAGYFVGDVDLGGTFDYICISPKDDRVAKKVGEMKYFPQEYYDIKVVTDLKTIGMGSLESATMLMPLTVYNDAVDKETRQKVWDYCVKHKLHYSGRLHIEVWGQKKGI